MYTNVPVRSAINTLVDVHGEFLCRELGTDLVGVRRLLEYALIDAALVGVGGEVYKQQRGLAMGSALSPCVADVFMDQVFAEASSLFSKKGVVLCLKYADDLLFLGPAGVGPIVRRILLEVVENMHIRNGEVSFFDFAISQEDGLHSLVYLDMRIYRKGLKVFTCWCPKACSSDRTLHYLSAHPMSAKENVCRGLVERGLRISHPIFYLYILMVTYWSMLYNDYPAWKAMSMIEGVLDKILQTDEETPQIEAERLLSDLMLVIRDVHWRCKIPDPSKVISDWLTAHPLDEKSQKRSIRPGAMTPCRIPCVGSLAPGSTAIIL